MADSLIIHGRGVSTIPENCPAALVVATASMEAVDTVDRVLAMDSEVAVESRVLS